MTITAAAPPRTAAPTARRRQAASWLFSIAVHLALGLTFFGSASGDLTASPEGAADHGVMTVTLVRPKVTAAPQDQASGALRPLMSRVENGQRPVEFQDSETPGSVGRLFQRLSAAHPSTASLPPERTTETRLPVASSAGRDPSDSRAAGERGRSPGADAARPGSTGGLWGAVQPCWRRLEHPTAVPVTLEVSLDVSGRLSDAPRIIRAAGPVDEKRLRAEASALSALAACLPRGDLRFAGRTHRLEFLPDE